jgi:hypothetical protein
MLDTHTHAHTHTHVDTDMLGDLSSKLEGMGAMPVLGMGPLGMGDGGRGRDKKQVGGGLSDNVHRYLRI